MSAEDKKEERMKTVYTHGNKFEIPLDKDVEEFLKEQYPEECK